jgi:hypothetical protein
MFFSTQGLERGAGLILSRLSNTIFLGSASVAIGGVIFSRYLPMSENRRLTSLANKICEHLPIFNRPSKIMLVSAGLIVTAMMVYRLYPQLGLLLESPFPKIFKVQVMNQSPTSLAVLIGAGICLGTRFIMTAFRVDIDLNPFRFIFFRPKLRVIGQEPIPNGNVEEVKPQSSDSSVDAPSDLADKEVESLQIATTSMSFTPLSSTESALPALAEIKQAGWVACPADILIRIFQLTLNQARSSRSFDVLMTVCSPWQKTLLNSDCLVSSKYEPHFLWPLFYYGHFDVMEIVAFFDKFLSATHRGAELILPFDVLTYCLQNYITPLQLEYIYNRFPDVKISSLTLCLADEDCMQTTAKHLSHFLQYGQLGCLTIACERSRNPNHHKYIGRITAKRERHEKTEIDHRWKKNRFHKHFTQQVLKLVENLSGKLCQLRFQHLPQNGANPLDEMQVVQVLKNSEQLKIAQPPEFMKYHEEMYYTDSRDVKYAAPFLPHDIKKSPPLELNEEGLFERPISPKNENLESCGNPAS